MNHLINSDLSQKTSVKGIARATMWTVMLATLSFTAQARYANQTSTFEQIRAQQPTEAITVCYYRPKVWRASTKRTFKVELTGHVSCNQEYNMGVLYYLKHAYK